MYILMQAQRSRKHLRHNKERKIKMRKVYIIIAHTGQEVFDSTQEAQERIAAMKYCEEKYKREQKLLADRKRKFTRNLLYRLAAFCGMV